MKIDYTSPKLTSKTMWFYGEINKKEFTIVAVWTEWDGWEVDDIMWDNEEGTDDEREEIIESFTEKME